MLISARASGESVEKARWAEALRESYRDVDKKEAVEWWDGAPRDRDKYGTRIVQVWPGADHGGDEGCRVAGRRAPSEAVGQRQQERERAVAGWEVGENGELLKEGRAAELGDADGLPCVRLLMEATAMLLEEGAEVDRSAQGSVREAGSWAVHVETSKRLLDEWNDLHVKYDIQFAAATDGGRQLSEHGGAVASAAALRDDGKLVGGALDAETWARSSYECEMQALICLLNTWPAGSRVLIAMDARSPVQAVVKFRDAHVNRRAEYFCDEMLDELLREIESMDTVIFYWLKGHSGAAPNEAADFQATALLEEEPMDVGPRPVRRHASLTFAFDRRPFAWAAERAARHIQAVMRGRSHRSIWRDTGGWELKWGKGEADRKRILQAAQMRRLLVGDESYFEGERAARAKAIACRCGGGFCNTSHWFFECGLVRAREQRAALKEKVGDVAISLNVLNGGKPDVAANNVVRALAGRGVGEQTKLQALAWLVGCMPKPKVDSKGSRALAMDALRQSADTLRAGADEYKQEKVDFLAAERGRTLAIKVGARLRAWVALRGPGSTRAVDRLHINRVAAISGERRAAVDALGPQRMWRQESCAMLGLEPRRISNGDDWVQSYEEWSAAMVILHWSITGRFTGPVTGTPAVNSLLCQ